MVVISHGYGIVTALSASIAACLKLRSLGSPCLKVIVRIARKGTELTLQQEEGKGGGETELCRARVFVLGGY